jgi:N-acetylglucosamine kinase-like BadF-type ATPase
MSDLIRNLQEALEEMTKTGNEKAINILEKAIQQANKLINQKQVPQ